MPEVSEYGQDNPLLPLIDAYKGTRDWKDAFSQALRRVGQNVGVVPTPEKRQLRDEAQSVMPEMSSPAQRQIVQDLAMGFGTDAGAGGGVGAIRNVFHGTNKLTADLLRRPTGIAGTHPQDPDIGITFTKDPVVAAIYADRPAQAKSRNYEFNPKAEGWVHTVDLEWPDPSREARDPLSIKHFTSLEDLKKAQHSPTSVAEPDPGHVGWYQDSYPFMESEQPIFSVMDPAFIKTRNFQTLADFLRSHKLDELWQP